MQSLVYICAHMCVHTHVRTCVYILMCAHVCTYSCAHMCVHTHVRTCVYILMWALMRVNMWTHACMYTCTSVCLSCVACIGLLYMRCVLFYTHTGKGCSWWSGRIGTGSSSHWLSYLGISSGEGAREGRGGEGEGEEGREEHKSHHTHLKTPPRKTLVIVMSLLLVII